MNDVFSAEDDEFGLIGSCISGGNDVCFDAFAEVPTEAIQHFQLQKTYELIKGLVSQSKSVSLPELMKEWKLPSDMVYLNKINYAMYHVLTNLKLEGNFSNYFKELFKVI